MDARQLTGAILVAGLTVFMVGAVRWRLSYDKPLPEALPQVARDRNRWTWIHLWMLVAMFLTPAGLAAFATLPGTGTGRAFAAMAAAVYGVGAVAWVMSLAFRLTVTRWAAERTVATGTTPDGFPAFEAWAVTLFAAHLVSAYAAFTVLGAAVLTSGVAPAWVGWVGVGWGIVFLAGFVATRSAGPFSPPLFAHGYPALVGGVLLATNV